MERRITKRTIGKLLAFVMSIIIMPFTARHVEASTKIDVAPYAKIEYGNTNNVQCGTIRYVQQNGGQTGDGPNYYSNYWSPADMATARWNCYAASVSMALSYIGVNRLPGAIYSGGCQWSQPGATFQQPSIATGVQNYINGNGKYSPVILHIIPYAGRASGEHWVIIAGRVSGNTYRIVDPINASHGSTWNATISGNTMTYWNGCSDTITQVFQYYNPNGKIVDDKTKPTISNVQISNLNSSGYKVTCTVSDNVGVTQVKFPTWTDKNGQDDLIWHVGSVSGNTASFTVKVSDHKGESGTYYTDIYAYDAAGNFGKSTHTISVPAPDYITPTITNVRISDVSSTGYTVHCTVWDNETIAKVLYVTWTPDKGGFDDKKEEAKTTGFSGKGKTTVLSFRVNTKDHNNETGRYATHIYAYDRAGNWVGALTNAAVGGKYWGVTASTTYGGHTYELYDTTYWNWTTAKAYCDSVGGYLVCITSSGEQKAVESLLSKGKRKGYWIGATDQYEEGKWTWCTGETMSYKHFQSGQPDDYNKQEDYGMLWKNSGDWNDVPEDVRENNGEGVYGFICEYPWVKDNGTSNPSAEPSKPVALTKQNQTIIANSVIKTLGNKAFELGASAPGKLTYKSNNTEVATINKTGKVTIKGSGIATITINAASTSTYKAASKQVTITVLPKAAALKSLANSKKGKLVIRWKKGSGISGYRIQVAQNANFKGAKTYTIKKAETVSKTVSVKKGKTYWVRIQTYKGNVASGWSKVKKIKIKK